MEKSLKLLLPRLVSLLSGCTVQPNTYSSILKVILFFLTILGVTEILCSFRLTLEQKTGKEIPDSSRLEFLEKFSANNFTLSDVEDNTSGLLNRGGIANLPLLRTVLAICQKSQKLSFWEVMDSFALLPQASLAASKPSCIDYKPA